MKKILILAMSCRIDYFQEEINIIKQTWAAQLPKNIDFGYYDGEWDTNDIIDDNGYKHIRVTTPDDINNSFRKTIYALNMVINDYDYILRTNTSNWINVRLLRKFIDEMVESDKIYGSELYSLSEAAAPYPLDMYVRGNGILMSAKLWKILIRECCPLLYIPQSDDVSIGSILNSWLRKKHGDRYYEMYRSMPQGWYKCVDTECDNHHKLCRWGEKKDKEFYKNFMIVQTKMYRNRETELDNMLQFGTMMKDIDDISLDMTREYIKDPSVFIGSVIGYMSYSKWVEIPKTKLYMFTTQHKAIDDPANKNYSQKAYDKYIEVPTVNK